MAMSMIQAFDSTIVDSYRLNKTGSFFEIVEYAKTATNKRLKIGGCQGVGFSLDQTGGHPWQFIVHTPLKGITSVCDGILVLKYNNKNYIVVLDLKSKNAGAKAWKQIQSGLFLCEWLCSLLKLNAHINEPYEFIGVVCKSRGSVAKQASRKGLNATVEIKSKIPIITIANPGTIHIRDLLDVIEQS